MPAKMPVKRISMRKPPVQQVTKPAQRPATVKPSQLHLRGEPTPKRVIIPELSKYEPKNFTTKSVKENAKRFTKKDIRNIIKKTSSLDQSSQQRYLLSLGIDGRLLKNTFTVAELKNLLSKNQLQSLIKEELTNKLNIIKIENMAHKQLLLKKYTGKELIKILTKEDILRYFGTNELIQKFTGKELLSKLTKQDILASLSREQLLYKFTKKELMNMLPKEYWLNKFTGRELLSLFTKKELANLFSLQEILSVCDKKDIQRTYSVKELFNMGCSKAVIYKMYGKDVT